MLRHRCCDRESDARFQAHLGAERASLKVALSIAPVRSDVEIEAAIIALGREPGGGLVAAVSDAFMSAHRVPVILAAARNNVPAVYTHSAFVRDGLPSTISMH